MDELLQTLKIFLPFVVVLVRVAGIMMLAPIFGHASVPAKVKIGLSLLVTLVIYPVSGVSAVHFPDGLLACALIVMKEAAIGMIIGYATMLAFTAFQIAGSFIGTQMGLGESTLLDPMFEANSSAIGQVITIMALLIFLSIGGHRWFILAIASSYNTMPVAAFSFSNKTMETVLAMFSGIFVSGIKIAAPVLGVLLIMIVAIAIMARIAPQINILIFSVSIRIAVGCIILGVSLPFIVRAINNVIGSLQKEVLVLLAT